MSETGAFVGLFGTSAQSIGELTKLDTVPCRFVA